jgi:hypothetical protein
MRNFLLILASIVLSNTAMAASASIEINNRSDWEIHYLYLSPSSSSEWGPDQLGNDVIDTNSSYTLTGISCNTYDVRLVDEDDDECVLSEIRMCKGSQRLDISSDMLLNCQNSGQGNTVASTGTVTMYNATRWDIYELYLSSSNQSSWGDDLLGWGTWDSGVSLDLTTGGCGDYDLKMVDEDNDVCEVTGIYMCGDHGNINLTDDDLLDCLSN